MRDYSRVFIALVFTFFLFSRFPGSALANYTFNSNFDLDFNSWITIPDHPIPIIESYDNKTYARFSAPYGRRFPFIAHKYNDNYISSVELEFSYLSGGASQGAGVMLSNIIPVSNQDPPNDTGDYSVGIWNLGSDYYIVSPLCDNIGGCGLNIYSRAVFKIPTTQWNKILFLYHEDGLEIKLNDSSVQIPYGVIHKRPIGIFIGNPVYATNYQNWLPFSIDNVSISYGDYIELDSFPYLSQKDPLWKDITYDSADEWAGDQANTIERWGCAITSVAMVLEKYGVKMPNGDLAKPDKINQWLKEQPDGYVGNGLLNWLAISRLVKESRAVGNATKDLEFIKSSGSATDELEDGYYPIINEGGHFLVAHAYNSDYYLINDPNNDQRREKPKNEQIVSLNTYIPSDTDLSYIMLVSEEDTSIATKHNDNAVGEAYQEEIRDEIDGSSTGEFRVLYIPKPSDGDYRLSINNAGTGASTVKIYSYDKDGNVDKTEQTVPAGSSEWMLNYHSDGTDPLIVELDSTPPTYVGTNSFSGWYNTPQTATFNFEDPNLPSDFVSPTCTISTEGKNKTCNINVIVCDKYNNCNAFSLTSNPANIDLTKPNPTKKVWGVRMWQLSKVRWLPTKDAELYRIEWGKDRHSLNSSYTTKKTWAWIPTPKHQNLYVRVVVIDRAGNESDNNTITELPIWRGHWKFW